MFSKFCILLYACLVLWQPAAAFAQGSTRVSTGLGAAGVSINADEMFRDSERRTIELRGHVQVIYQQQYLSCDRAIIHLDTQEIEAFGNLVINSQQAYVEGDGATLSYRDNTGTIVNGFVKSGQVIFEGKVVKKTGPSTYEAISAQYTACTTCPTAWTFSGSKIEAEIGGYAYIKNSILHVAKVPVFWLPYLIVPLKSERQTGLLVPQLEWGEGGTAISESYFWAISRSQDATFTAKNYSLRGLKGLLNYRYVLSPESEGELNTGYIRDQVFAGSPEVRDIHPDPGSKINRWFVDYYHSFVLPDGFVQKTKLALASDLRYQHDFPNELPGRGEPALENRFSLARNTERTHSSVDVGYYVNMLKVDPLAGNEDAVHRWPELRYSLIERSITDEGALSNVFFNMDVKYTNFAREGFGYDSMSSGPAPGRQVLKNTAPFDPNKDIVRTGQRFDIQPEISVPFHVGAIDFMPVAQFRHTQYSLNVDPPEGSRFDTSPYRQYVRSSISARTRLSRIYGDRSPEALAPKAHVTNWVDIESRERAEEVPLLHAPVRPNIYRHEVEPEVTFSGVPHIQQTDNSQFFGAATDVPMFLDEQPLKNSDVESPDGRGIQFDYEDRLVSRNFVNFGLTNRLVRKAWSGNDASYKQIVNWRLGQSYDFDEAARAPGRPTFPWSDVNSLLDVRLDHFETNTLLRYFPYHNKVNTSSRVQVMDGEGRFVQLNFKQEYDITTNVNDAYEGKEETVRFVVGAKARYATLAGSIDYTPLGWAPMDLRVRSYSALVNLRPPGDCWGILLTWSKPTGKNPEFNVGFDYQFGGASSM